MTDKDTILYIRCSRETKRKFAVYVKFKGFKDYEEALSYLLTLDVPVRLV